MKALVITAAGLNLGPLREALAGAGVDEILVLGSHVGDRVLDEDELAFVVGVLSPASGRPSADRDDDGAANVPGFADTDVMLRVGRLVERGLQGLVIVPPPSTPPAPADGLVAALCPADDPATLNLHMWAFVSGLPARMGRRSVPTADVPQITSSMVENPAAVIKRLKVLLREAGQPAASFQVERIVMEALQRAGADVAASHVRSAGDAGYDLAVIPFHGAKDVFLVEVIAGRLERRRLRDHAFRLQQAVIRRDGALGMLIYQDAEGRRFEPDVVPAVITMSAEDLLNRLQSQSLKQLVDEEVAAAARRL